MKPVWLSDNFYVKIRTTYGNEEPSTARLGVLYRSVRLTVTLFLHNGEQLEVFTGVSYCSPEDQFSKKTGRRLATSRLFADPRCKQWLSPDAYLILLPILRTGRISESTVTV